MMAEQEDDFIVMGGGRLESQQDETSLNISFHPPSPEDFSEID
jgi:hypothetical protein